eukprot:Platyproteum_vivax@DN7485_c0_g1_i7.p1
MVRHNLVGFFEHTLCVKQTEFTRQPRRRDGVLSVLAVDYVVVSLVRFRQAPHLRQQVVAFIYIPCALVFVYIHEGIHPPSKPTNDHFLVSTWLVYQVGVCVGTYYHKTRPVRHLFHLFRSTFVLHAQRQVCDHYCYKALGMNTIASPSIYNPNDACPAGFLPNQDSNASAVSFEDP